MSQRTEFQARLSRIEARASHTKGTIYVGMDESFAPRQREVVKLSRRREIAGNAVLPLSYVGAFAIGLFAVMLGRYARFQIMTGQHVAFDPMLDWMINGAVGAAVAFALGQMFRLTSKEHMFAKSLGVFAMICIFHNFVHLMPNLFAVLFSPEWVQQMLIDTKPNSILFRGIFFML